MMIPCIPQKSRRACHGSAVIVVLVLLAIMTIMIGANSMAVRGLAQEVKLIDSRHVQRLQH
jgi:hypothetical protein